MGDSGRDGRATLRTIFAAARDPELSADELRVWLLYRSYEGRSGGGAFPGDELLAEHMGKSPRTVRRHRGRLLEAGYLEQELRGPRPARYRAVLPEKADEGETAPWGLGEIPSFEGWNGDASRFFAQGVQEVLWRGKHPPPDAPEGWTMGAELKRIKIVWGNLGTAGTVRRVWGLRYLAEDGELSCRGSNGELRRLEPDEGFTLGLLEHYREEGKWQDAEERYRDRRDEGGADELAEAVEFARAQGGDS